MSLFQECRCLRCGSALPLQVLWDFARVNDAHFLPGLNLLTRSGRLRGKTGIACPNCGATFRIVQTRIRIVRVMIWAAFFGSAAFSGARQPNPMILDLRLTLHHLTPELCDVGEHSSGKRRCSRRWRGVPASFVVAGEFASNLPSNLVLNSRECWRSVGNIAGTL